MTDATTLYPLLFSPIYKEKVWGGRTLEKELGRNLPGNDDTLIGESWELADLSTTSVSGGGGGAERSVVRNGPLAGKTLHDLIEQFGNSVHGDLPLTDTGDFPLLLKFLDANDNLSVQVHPSPEYAAAHEDAFLKSEAWYILACEPGAKIYKGIKPGVTPEQYRKAIEDDTVADLMVALSVEPGDIHYLPSGTCHALGEGVLVAEVQTPSDTTYRVYDWGRTGRELHIDQAMACIDFGPCDAAKYEPGVKLAREDSEVTSLVECEFFKIDRIWAQGGFTEELPAGEPRLWMVLEGQGELACDGHDAVPFAKGDTLLLPAQMPTCSVTASTAATWLEVTFPQAKKTQIA